MWIFPWTSKDVSTMHRMNFALITAHFCISITVRAPGCGFLYALEFVLIWIPMISVELLKLYTNRLEHSIMLRPMEIHWLKVKDHQPVGMFHDKSTENTAFMIVSRLYFAQLRPTGLSVFVYKWVLDVIVKNLCIPQSISIFLFDWI